jgi:hypothetical protein
MSVSNDNLILNRFYGSPGQIGRLLLASTLVYLGSQIVSPVAAGILAANPECQIYLFRDSRPFNLLTMAFFIGDKGEMLTYMRLTETDGLAGTGPLSDAEIEALLLFNQSGGPWKKREKGLVEPVKAMWLSGDGKYVAAYNDTGAMRALNIIPLKFHPATAGSNSAE